MQSLPIRFDTNNHKLAIADRERFKLRLRRIHGEHLGTGHDQIRLSQTLSLLYRTRGEQRRDG